MTSKLSDVDPTTRFTVFFVKTNSWSSNPKGRTTGSPPEEATIKLSARNVSRLKRSEYQTRPRCKASLHHTRPAWISQFDGSNAFAPRRTSAMCTFTDNGAEK